MVCKKGDDGREVCSDSDEAIVGTFRQIRDAILGMVVYEDGSIMQERSESE